ncbi:hypothetical protein EIP86_007812 [Pleurotus ostreatoroseus]|nr:hypothetical protein EIP86_007812 [Pleurotus ostreatoroseus]
MDPTSLVLIALELADIRENREEAFEYFVRAWHQAHPPSATIRLASHYLPINAVLPELLSSPLHTPTTPTNDSAPESPRSADSTPVSAHSMAPYAGQQTVPIPGSLSYYLYHVGGAEQLAQLYLEAGLLYLEGTAPSLLSSSYAGLSSLRTPTMSATYPQPSQRPSYLDVHMSGSAAGSGSTSGSEAWRRDQEVARRFFDRARDLHPGLDVPLLPPSDSDPDSSAQESPVSRGEQQLKMPTIELPDAREVGEKQLRKRQRQRKTETASVGASTESVSDRVSAGDEDNTWYLYLPGLVGAVLVVGFLSFSSWRKNQYS